MFLFFLWSISLFFCCCFIFLLLRNEPTSSVKKRFLKYIQPSPSLDGDTVRFQPCRFDSDCSSATDQVCFQGACLVKFRRGDACDAATGLWTLVDRTRIACTCKFPDLVTQRFPGGNCDVEIACGPVGRLKRPALGGDLRNSECDCPPGYVSARNLFDGKPSCRRETAMEKIRRETAKNSCREDEIDLRHDLSPPSSSSLSVFKSSFFSEDVAVGRCVKRPCIFDALTGRPLKRARFLEGWGCVCDPRRGNVGVRIDSLSYMVNAPGYNACINIFRDGEPARDLSEVKLYTYFYLFDKIPISFVQWSDLPSDPQKFAQPFRQMITKNVFSINITLQMGEIWPHNYTQFVLKHEKFAVYVPGRIGPIVCPYGRPKSPIPPLKACIKRLLMDYRMVRCKEIAPNSNAHPSTAYLNYPVCRIDPGDVTATSVYDDAIVSSPAYANLRETLPDYDEYKHSNAIELKPFEGDPDVWQLDWAPSHPDFAETDAFPDLIPKFDHLPETS